MVKLVGHMNLKDYNQWRTVFDSMKPVRKNYGSTGEKIFRTEGNNNEVLVMLEWSEVEQAKKFSQSQDLKDAMQRAGVIDSEFFFSA